jgi:hypothetical protein
MNENVNSKFWWVRTEARICRKHRMHGGIYYPKLSVNESVFLTPALNRHT